MPVTVQFLATSGNIHQGPGFLFWNILRPLFGFRPLIGAGNPPTISDPASPSAWIAITAYTAGQYVLDTNNNVQLCTTGGTSQTPGPPTWSTIVGATTVDGSVTWTLAGPSWIWVATTAVIFDQQLRDSNNNVQQCIVAGTTKSSSHPTWSTQLGGITTDGTAEWMCLGPSTSLGANEGALTYKMTPKMESMIVDQYASPVDFFTTSEDGEIDGTLTELTITNVGIIMPNTTITSGTDVNFPANAQNYQEASYGGVFRVPRPCAFVCSPQRQFGNSTNLANQPFKYFGGTVYAVGPNSDGTLPFTLKKMTTFKVKCVGSVVTWRPAGDQVGSLFKQI